MLPASTPRRKEWPKMGHTDSRGTENPAPHRPAQSAPPSTCPKSARTRSRWTARFMQGRRRHANRGPSAARTSALVDAIAKLPKGLSIAANDFLVRYPAALRPAVLQTGPKRCSINSPPSAVGIIDGEARLDLDYLDDVRAESRHERRVYRGREIRRDPGFRRGRGKGLIAPNPTGCSTLAGGGMSAAHEDSTNRVGTFKAVRRSA